jgi:hypothetical protein
VKDFGLLKQSCIYIRLGSSTHVATPSEIEDIYAQRLRTAELTLLQSYIRGLVAVHSKQLEPQLTIRWSQGGESSDSLHRVLHLHNAGAFPIDILSAVFQVCLKTRPNEPASIDANITRRVLSGMSEQVQATVRTSDVTSVFSAIALPIRWDRFSVSLLVTYKGSDEVVQTTIVQLAP